jgi:hypothetical protein
MSAASPLRNPIWWHVAALVGVSSAYQSLFVHYGIGWLFDEGWPLYAAMRLHDGGVLYGDVLFPFPPGHLLPAWVAFGVDPPGIIGARVLYSAFDVSLCVALYFLARRLTTPTFAFLAALLLAVAAPRSQLAHLLFGYRYLIFSVIVLLLLDARLRLVGEERRRAIWLLFAAGFFAGVALFFRLTPAFAVSCGVCVAVMTASRHPRTWVRDWLAYAAGLAVVTLPLLAWFFASVGLDVLWREVVTRIVALQSAQSLPSPPFSLLPASGDRDGVYHWWVSFQYRLYILLYAAYAVGLLAAWWRAGRERRRFEHGLLLAVVVWGGIYLFRTLGRSDDHHLMSALPPALLVLAHALEWGTHRVFQRVAVSPRLLSGATFAVCAIVLSGWVYLQRVDLYLSRDYRGTVPIASTGGQVEVTRRSVASGIDGVVETVSRITQPDDVILDMSGGPLFYPLTGRRGPGGIDVISPGIFLSAREEGDFVALLLADPPAAVIWPAADFDDRPNRGIEEIAPQLSAWVERAYREVAAIGRYRILQPVAGVLDSK